MSFSFSSRMRLSAGGVGVSGATSPGGRRSGGMGLLGVGFCPEGSLPARPVATPAVTKSPKNVRLDFTACPPDAGPGLSLTTPPMLYSPVNQYYVQSPLSFAGFHGRKFSSPGGHPCRGITAKPPAALGDESCDQACDLRGACGQGTRAADAHGCICALQCRQQNRVGGGAADRGHGVRNQRDAASGRLGARRPCA